MFCLSYDEPDALADFATAHGVDFPLLSDPDSTIIERFGILNTLIPEDDHPWYGIPFPGAYIIDADGVIIDKFFEHNLALRPNAAQLLRSALGERIELPTATAEDEVTIDVAAETDALSPGLMSDLVVTFAVPAGRHLYSEPVPEGLVAATVEIDDDPGLILRDAIVPSTRPLTLGGTGDVLQVFDGSFRIRVPMTINGSVTEKLDDGSRVATISGTVRWQSCDDETCGLPQQQRFSLAVPTKPTVRNEIGGPTPGTPPMNSAAHFERMRTRRA